MPRIILPTPQEVPADSKPTLDMFTKNIGFTPNMMATFALSPIAFNAWAALLGSLSKALDVKTRDSIGLAVSEVNGCDYCLTVHSFTAEHMAKMSADEIVLARQGHASDPKRHAAVQFARKVIETRGKVSDADLQSCPRCRLHGCARHRDRRVGGHVLPDELFQQRVRAREGLSRRSLAGSI